MLPRFGPRPTVELADARQRLWRRRYRWQRLVYALSLLLLVLVAWMANVQRAQRMREEGTFVRSDRLSERDLALSAGRGRFDAWKVDLAPGQTLRIVLRTSDLAPYFYVAGPMAAEPPPVAARSRATSAGIASAEFSPAEAGEYVVVVSSEQNTYGAYELTTNYRTTSLSTRDSEVRSAADGILVAIVLVCGVQYVGLVTFLGWRHPDRILLLRPFGARRVSRALKRFNRRSLAYRGFTFTLADKHLKESLVSFLLDNVPADPGSLITALYRPLFRRLHRRVSIRKPRDLAILRLRLRSRWMLSRFWQSWLGLGDRINKFNSRDDLWKDCVGTLLDDCDVIVVDLSQAGEGTLWELQELVRRGYAYKSLFVVRDDDAEEHVARAVLDRVGVLAGSDAARLPALHRYAAGDGRLRDPDAFDRAYAAAAANDKHPARAPLPISRKAVLAIAPLPLAPFWFPAGLVLATLALRDIRRAHGQLRGELLAHGAIAMYSLVALVLSVIAVVSISRR